MSAATSVEAMEQGGDDEEGENQAAGGVTSVPTMSTSRISRPTSLHGMLPVAPRQRSPGIGATANKRKTAGTSGLEQGHSVVYDSQYQRNMQSAGSHQLSGLSPPRHGQKRQRPDVDPAGPSTQPNSDLLLSPECSGASGGHSQAASQHDTCQLAPETTQQATIQEVQALY